jgi:hypothetical protein
MANAFTIRIFVPDGDPEGMRVIDRMGKTRATADPGPHAKPRARFRSVLHDGWGINFPRCHSFANASISSRVSKQPATKSAL